MVMDFAAFVIKDDTDDYYTAEIIVDGEIAKSAVYNTQASAFKFITAETIRYTRTKETQ